MNQEEIDDLDAELIADRFGGDEEAFKSSLRESKRELLHWHDINAAARTFPELEDAAFEVIERLLGYIPQTHITIRYEPFLRALLNNYRIGSSTLEEALDESEEYIKQMRNEDLEGHTDIFYKRWVHKQYETDFLHVKQKARERVTKFLCYEPDLETSMGAEIILRKYLADDKRNMSKNEMTNPDFQVMTIIKYREVLLKNGRDAADASPLMGIDIRACYKANSQMNY